MNVTSRFFIFLIIFIFIVGIGSIAALNSAVHPQVYVYGQDVSGSSAGEPVQSAQLAQGSSSASIGPFATSTTSIDFSTATSSIEEADQVQAAPRPGNDISAEAYLVGNVLTGKIYLSSDASQPLSVASMSKLITAIVSTDTLSPTTTIEITPAAADTAPDGSNLLPGEKFTLRELLRPLLLSSSNVAADAIASADGGPAFMKLMSSVSWEVGMPTAYFADPSGIDPLNSASAQDMFDLARYLYKFRPDILAITRTPQVIFATTTNHGSHIVDSIHPFVTDPRFIGGKTGRTPQAGETMLTILRIQSQPIAFIILHSAIGERARDTDILIRMFESLSDSAKK